MADQGAGLDSVLAGEGGLRDDIRSLELIDERGPECAAFPVYCRHACLQEGVNDAWIMPGRDSGARVRGLPVGYEIGHGSGNVISLSRTLQGGETIYVTQRVGQCLGSLAFSIEVQ